MKKLSIVLVIFSLSLINLSAQAPLGKGGRQLNAGLGFSGWGVPIYCGVDFGVHPDITVGFEGTIRSYSGYWKNSPYTYTTVGLSGNGNYHFNKVLEIPSNWDFYAGLNLGFYFGSASTAYGGTGVSPLGLGLQVGGRYFFNKKFGLNLEFGGGNEFSGGKFGITYRFR
jgi:hypothetical protein